MVLFDSFWIETVLSYRDLLWYWDEQMKTGDLFWYILE